jgi:hypothetical protein
MIISTVYTNIVEKDDREDKEATPTPQMEEESA